MGDATKHELLEHAGIARAAVLLVTVDNAKVVKRMVEVAKKNWPEVAIIVRAYDHSHSDELMQAGATEVVSEVKEASLQLTSHVLFAMGKSREEANACVRV